MDSSLKAAFIAAGLDPRTGRPVQLPLNSKAPFWFVFYIMTGGNPFLVVPPGSSPIIKHMSSTTMPADAALEALVRGGLVRPGTGEPTVINPISGLFGIRLIFFIKIDQTALAPQGHSVCSTKKYSLVDPKTGKSQRGKDRTIHSFGVSQYSAIYAKLFPTSYSDPLPSLAEFACAGGGGGAFAGGGAAVASPHHGGGKRSHPAPTCGHDLCTHLHRDGAGHGAIVLPVFQYKCSDGSKKSVVIMVFEKGFWNLLCEGMEGKDIGCWIRTIDRALREEGKIFLSRHLEEADIRLGNLIRTTPVFYVQLDRSMVTHDLSRGVLNAQVAVENSNTSLPSCYKEIRAIGFFERVGNRLVPLDGNPAGYLNTFSPVVRSWLSS
jgi:hypothetical protein